MEESDINFEGYNILPEVTTVDTYLNSVKQNDRDGNLSFFIPRYNYAEYVNNISAWQKQIRDINGAIGWFYFKVFFKFNTEFGLLGGLMENTASTNTAIKYLKNISDKSFQYSSCKINDRILALYKFANMLKHISCDVPWFFKGVSGLASIKYPYTSEFQKDKSVFLECSEEAIDMRISTLIDLYKYACYDNIYSREIIPSNLRKFDMSLIIMHVPLKYHHEPTLYVQDNNLNEKHYGKSLDMLNGEDFSNLASFKMFTFQNCEINIENSAEVYGDVLSNENLFNMGKNKIKIDYDRVFEHRMNEWNEFLLGDDGFYYNNSIPFNLNDENFKRLHENDFLINAKNQSSTHRQILGEINDNRTFSNNYLMSYSDYFLNTVWETFPVNTKWSELVNNLHQGINNVRGAWNSVANNATNFWDNLTGKKEHP